MHILIRKTMFVALFASLIAAIPSAMPARACDSIAANGAGSIMGVDFCEAGFVPLAKLCEGGSNYKYKYPEIERTVLDQCKRGALATFPVPSQYALGVREVLILRDQLTQLKGVSVAIDFQKALLALAEAIIDLDRRAAALEQNQRRK